ncbi:MAG: hypothetical protein J6S69_10360 [Proteobacteria bacterium]|nr:hypothetical protein [Pseudomonadota bacterium]
MKVLKLVYFFVFSFLYVCMMTGYAWADGQVGHAEMGVSSTSSQSSIEIYDGDNHVIWHPNGETMPSSNSDVQENVNINDRVQNSADMHILNLDDVAQNSTVIIINPTNTQNNINIIIKTSEQTVQAPAEVMNGGMDKTMQGEALENAGEEKSWQRGFDMRFNFGALLLFADKNIDGGFGLRLDLGYRWKYVGIYAECNVLYTLGMMALLYGWGVRGLFYIPLRENLEFVLGLGVTQQGLMGLDIPVSAGLNWHLGDMVLGLDLIYDPVMWPDEPYDTFHNISLNLAIGYTF